MRFRILRAGALAVGLGAALSPVAASAQGQSLEQRLRELESAYTELLVRDREKSQELERMRGEVSALRQGKPDAGRPAEKAPAAQDHDHGHAHGPEHDHGHAPEHVQVHDGTDAGGSDVLVESGGFRLYVPSLALDLVGYRDDSAEDLESRLDGLRGFGHAHGEEEHDHARLKDGFNLRHAEVGFAAEAVGFGRAQVLINAEEDGVELEEAFIQSAPIAGFAQLKAGRFRSAFGFFNQYHSPEWKLADAPLPHFLLFGDHGLDGTGVQAVLAPPGISARLGVEVFQGGGETIFSRDDAAGKVEEPSVFVGWLKGAAFERGDSRMELGLAGGLGRHQEVHEEGGDESEKLKGDAWFLSPGLSFHRRGNGPHGAGDVMLRGEYVYRVKDLENVDNDETVESMQDGYYLEAAFGFAPRFEAGLRWEQAGLINETTEEDQTETFGTSWRIGAFFAFEPVRWTRLGLQANYGSYDFESGRDEVWQALGRAVFRFGPHFH